MSSKSSSGPSNSNNNSNANQIRIRDNQRRSRARRKEYLQELEQRLRECERKGVEASAEVQQAARRVLDENKTLRTLLSDQGVSDETIDACLRAHRDSVASIYQTTVGSSSEPVQALEQLLSPPGVFKPNTTNEASQDGSKPTQALDEQFASTSQYHYASDHAPFGAKPSMRTDLHYSSTPITPVAAAAPGLSLGPAMPPMVGAYPVQEARRVSLGAPPPLHRAQTDVSYIARTAADPENPLYFSYPSSHAEHPHASVLPMGFAQVGMQTTVGSYTPTSAPELQTLEDTENQRTGSGLASSDENTAGVDGQAQQYHVGSNWTGGAMQRTNSF